MPTCPRCHREFPRREGRGGRSAFCDDCKLLRRSEQSAVRGLRSATVDMGELVDLFAGRLALLHTKVADRQQKACAECGREGKLYLIRTRRRYVGLCLNDWEKRRVESG